MPGYQDLRKAFASGRQKYADYHTECIHLGGGLVTALRAYLGCPPEALTLRPLNLEPEDGAHYTVPGSMHLDDDTYWHLGVVLTVYEAPDIFPQEDVQLRFRFKKFPGYYEVRLAEFPDEFRIMDPRAPEQFKPLFELLAQTLIDKYENGLQQFLFGGARTASGVNVVGFRMPAEDEGGGDTP